MHIGFVLKATPEHAWLNEVTSVCLQQSLRDLQAAFSNFFYKCAAHPSFKRKEARQSANYTERGFSFDAERRILKLAKIGEIKVKWSRKVIPHPSSIRLIRTSSGKYFVSLVVETQPASLPETGQSVGVDSATRSTARSGSADWRSTRSALPAVRKAASGA